MYSYTLIFKEGNDIIKLIHKNQYNQHEFNNIVKKLRRESYDNQKGYRSKYEMVSDVVEGLKELGFEQQVSFTF